MKIPARDWLQDLHRLREGIQFLRPWTEKVHGIPPEQVIGSRGRLKYEWRDGKLDKGLNEAKVKGWTVVSMKDEWKMIFPFGKK